jgi:hypothetical protein
MASDQSRAVYRALLANDAGVALWDAETTLVQTSPRPGVPDPDQVTGLTLTSSGEQAEGTHLRILTLRGGLPEIDGATFVWRNSTDDTDEYRGWEPPGTISGYEAVRVAPSGTLVSTARPHAISLADGTVVTAYQTDDSGRAPADDGIEVSVRSPTADTWSTVTVYSTSFALPTSQAFHPCLLRLPSGRLHLYHWVFDPVTATTGLGNVRMWYSDDDGATWALGQSYCLADDVAYASTTGAGLGGYILGRLRCAYANGQVLLVAHLQARDTDLDYLDTLAQWHSTDDGVSFKLVNGAWSTDDVADSGGMLPEVLAAGSGFVVLYLTAIDRKPRARVVSSASYDLEVATAYDVASATEAWATVAGKVLVLGDLGACVDETGAIFAFGRQPTVTGEGILVRSTDGGVTWSGVGQGSSTAGLTTWWAANDVATYPTAFSACPSQGRIVMVGTFTADPGTADPSLVAIYLGGYSTHTLPGYTRFARQDERVSWERTWLPFDEPGDTYWTAAGAGSDALGSGALTVTTTIAQTRSYTRAPTSSVDHGIIAEYSVEVTSGGSLSTNQVACLVRVDDGTEGWVVVIRHTATGFRVADATAATTIATVTLSGRVDIRVALGKDADGNGAVRVWYRDADATHPADRFWILGASSDALTDNAGAAGANAITWGHLTASASTSVWHRFLDVSDIYAGKTRLCSGQTNPDDLGAREFSPRGTYVDGGLILSATDGPTVRGDLWSVEASDDYPLARILPHNGQPSPRVLARWDSATQADVAVRWSEIGDASVGCDTIAIGLFGSTIGRVEIAGYDADTSAWVTLAAVNLYDGLEALPYVRDGNVVRPSTTAPADSPTLVREEVRGAYAWTYSAGHYAWEIQANTEGKWTNATTRRPVLRVDAASIDPTSGTLHIIPRDVVIVLHLAGVVYSGIRLRVPVPSSTIPRPPGGIHELGSLVVGPVVLMPEDYSWGRVVETDTATEIIEQADGTSTSRVRAVPRRLVEVGWVDGIETSAAVDPGGEADPDYLLASAASGALAAALVGTTPTVLDGIHRAQSGAAGHVVYLPRLVKGGASDVAVLLNRRGQHLYGRLEGPVRVENVLGEELDTELVRVATLTIREEV